MFNEDVLTQYYQEIADKLSEMIPSDEWEKIVMYAEEVGDVSGAAFYFYTDNETEVHHWSEIPQMYNVDENILESLMDELMGINKRLWLEFLNAGEQTWSCFSFWLDSEWGFGTEYGYEQDDETGPYEREVIWVYEKHGITPPGDYGKEILNEYLEQKDEQA